MIFETNLDDTFPSVQFLINDFKNPFHVDRNMDGGGIHLYFREGMPSDYCLTKMKIRSTFPLLRQI